MLYYLEQGPVEKIIIRQCLRERKPLPDKIQNAPDLMLGLELYWCAFMELSDSRSNSFSLGTIPWGVIAQYCRHHGLSCEQEEAMHFHLREMDAIFITHNARKDK